MGRAIHIPRQLGIWRTVQYKGQIPHFPFSHHSFAVCIVRARGWRSHFLGCPVWNPALEMLDAGVTGSVPCPRSSKWGLPRRERGVQILGGTESSKCGLFPPQSHLVLVSSEMISSSNNSQFPFALLIWVCFLISLGHWFFLWLLGSWS